MAQCNTLRADNRFQFVCPIFNATVELRTCFRLRDHQMVNRKVDVRKGCQAAMSSSKCPVWHIQQRLNRGEDEWFSATPKVGSLGEGIIGRIARIQTLEKDVARYDVPPRERELLMAANEMWRTNIKKVGKAAPEGGSMPALPAPASTTSSSDEIVKAAQRGDLAAALTAVADAENAPRQGDDTPSRKTRSAKPARAA